MYKFTYYFLGLIIKLLLYNDRFHVHEGPTLLTETVYQYMCVIINYVDQFICTCTIVHVITCVQANIGMAIKILHLSLEEIPQP